MTTIKTVDVRFVQELYPRLEHDEAAIERYRLAIDRLKPIVAGIASSTEMVPAAQKLPST